MAGISGVSGVSGISGLSGIGSLAPMKPLGAVDDSWGSTGGASVAGPSGGFAAALGDGISKLHSMQANSDTLAVKAATGDLTDVHDYMIAASQAKLATDLTVAVRNRAVEAFSEIMRMTI